LLLLPPQAHLPVFPSPPAPTDLFSTVFCTRDGDSGQGDVFPPTPFEVRLQSRVKVAAHVYASMSEKYLANREVLDFPVSRSDFPDGERFALGCERL
jgi:hypothetical protein